MEHWVYSLNIAGHAVSFNLDTLITMWITMLLLIVLALVTRSNLAVVPTRLQVIGEGIINYFVDIAKAGMGQKAAMQHAPLFLTLFFFILTGNLIGLLPWHLFHLHQGEFASPNKDLNMTAAMAVFVLLYYMYHGIKAKGLKKFFFHGFNLEGIIISLVDLLEHIVRPFSLAMRLFANILAGGILVYTILGIKQPYTAYLLPLPFMFFEIFVALIQALVFTLLSMTYISLSIQTEH